MDREPNPCDRNTEGHGRSRNGTTQIRYSEGSWAPSKFYIGTHWPSEEEMVVLDGGRKRSLERTEESERRMVRQRGMENKEEDDSEGEERRAIINLAFEDESGFDHECNNERKQQIERQDSRGNTTNTRHNSEITPSCPFDLERPEICFFSGQWERGSGAADKLGKPHLQFFVEFRDKVRCPQARRYLATTDGREFRGWLEPARSSAALEYVRKDRSRIGERIEIGIRGGSAGQKSQLNQIFEFMQNGGSPIEASTRWPGAFARNVNSIKFWGSYFDKQRDPDAEITVEIYWGITGSGKSFKAFSENPNAYRKMPGRWWDGYRGEECVIFDEFKPCGPDDWKQGSPVEIDLPYILRLCDRYPLMIEYKGGTMQMRATKFIFTSNFSPADWWQGHHQFPAFCRRVTRVLHFKEKWTGGEPKFVEQKLSIRGA